jgi:hypothetical protein
MLSSTVVLHAALDRGIRSTAYFCKPSTITSLFWSVSLIHRIPFPFLMCKLFPMCEMHEHVSGSSLCSGHLVDDPCLNYSDDDDLLT